MVHTKVKIKNHKFIYLDISYSNLTKHSIWQLYMSYVKENKADFFINLMPLPFHK